MNKKEQQIFSPVVSGCSDIKKNKKPYIQPDRKAVSQKIKLTRRQYQIYYYLIKQMMTQTQIANRLRIKRQTVNGHVKNLEILGVIQPVKKNANPKAYKTTTVIPHTDFSHGRSTRTTINKHAKKVSRRVGKTIKTVRDHKTGCFKGKRRGRFDGFDRDYDTVVISDGKRVPVFRVHSISYSCSVLNEPAVDVPWVKKGGPNGMEQWVLKHELRNNNVSVKGLKRVVVTFMRKRTKSSDEIVMYLPERYVLEYELCDVERILEEYAWKAHRWFQSTFKAYLGMPLQYRSVEIARELSDPALKRFVQDNGMVKVKTKRGYVMVDESKKGFPEIEYTTREQVEADLRSADRILDLEEQMVFLMDQQRKVLDMIRDLGDVQHQFHLDMQEFIGFRRSVEKKMEDDNKQMFS